MRKAAVVDKDQSGIAPSPTYLLKQQKATMIWQELEVEGDASVMRSVGQTTLDPCGKGMSCHNQNVEGVAFSSWYDKQDKMKVWHDCSRFGQWKCSANKGNSF